MLNLYGISPTRNDSLASHMTTCLEVMMALTKPYPAKVISHLRLLGTKVQRRTIRFFQCVRRRPRTTPLPFQIKTPSLRRFSQAESRQFKLWERYFHRDLR